MPNTSPIYSFRNKVREEIYKRRQLLKNRGYDAVFALDIKSLGYRFAQKKGVNPPAVYYQNAKLNDIDLEGLPASFVLKPEQSHSSVGVNLIHFIGQDKEQCLELLTNKRMCLLDVREAASKSMDEKIIADKWMVEELIYPDDGGLYAVDDWKFYCFYGEIGLILQKRKKLDGSVEYKLYDNEFNEVRNTGKYIGSINSDLPLALRMEEMSISAKLLSSAIPKPFMRIDLFSSLNGVYFGEFTPFPGGFSMFWKSWDERLGMMWLDAQERMEGDMRSGALFKLYDEIASLVKGE